MNEPQEPRDDPRGVDPGTGLRGRLEVPEHDPPWPPRPEGWRHDRPDPPDAFPVPFGIRDGLLAVGWSIVAQVLVLAPLASSSIETTEGPGLLLAILGSQVLTLGGVLWWLYARGRLSWRLLGPLRPRWKDLWVGLGVGVSGWLVVTLLLALADATFGPLEPPDQELLKRTTEGGVVTTVAIAIAVVGAPIVEEVIFRGLLFQSFRMRFGVFPAMGVSAFVWALVHFVAPIYIVSLAIFGFWLAAAFHRTGRLTVVITAHAVFNLIAVSLSFVAPPVGVS